MSCDPCRFYSGRLCGPSRAALQSGRNTIHVNVLNNGVGEYYLPDPISGYNGMPVNMTGIASTYVNIYFIHTFKDLVTTTTPPPISMMFHALQWDPGKRAEAGYQTAYSGKWNAGAATPFQTPHGRGYQKSLAYFSDANDYWTYQFGPNTLPGIQYFCNPDNLTVWDLYENQQPAYRFKPADHCSYLNQAKDCIHEDELFVDQAINYIKEYAKDFPKAAQRKENPLFLMLATHSIHTPLTPPTKYLNKYKFIKDEIRRRYSASHRQVSFQKKRTTFISHYIVCILLSMPIFQTAKYQKLSELSKPKSSIRIRWYVISIHPLRKVLRIGIVPLSLNICIAFFLCRSL